jgi:hypothetical protein
MGYLLEGETPNEYQNRHRRYRKLWGRPEDRPCEGGCQGRGAEWATIHGTPVPHRYRLYKDVVPLCVPCHRQYDATDRRERGYLLPPWKIMRKGMSNL